VVPVRELRGEPFVLFPRHLAPASYDVVIAMCRRAGFSPDIRHECADYQTMLSLVAAGLGLTLVPASVRNLGRVGVACRALSGSTAKAELVLMYHPVQVSRALETFIEIAQAAPGRGRKAAVVREIRVRGLPLPPGR
jgi:DNA-binding transcriptional LysR family regulator